MLELLAFLREKARVHIFDGYAGTAICVVLPHYAAVNGLFLRALVDFTINSVEINKKMFDFSVFSIDRRADLY